MADEKPTLVRKQILLEELSKLFDLTFGKLHIEYVRGEAVKVISERSEDLRK